MHSRFKLVKAKQEQLKKFSNFVMAKCVKNQSFQKRKDRLNVTVKNVRLRLVHTISQSIKKKLDDNKDCNLLNVL